MAKRLTHDVLGILGTRGAWTLMSMVSGVILARMLGPHDRGIFALVLLLPSTVVTLVKLGISQANVYYINRERAPIDQVASNSMVLALTSGLIAAVVVWLLRANLLDTVLRSVPVWALALALTRVPVNLLDNYLYGVLQATGHFSVYNSRLLVAEMVRLLSVSIALLVFHLGLFAAVMIYVCIGPMNIAFLLIAMRRRIRFSLKLNRGLLRQQLGFGVKSYIQTVTAHLLLRIDIYMVAYFLNPAATAFYALALHFTELVLEIPQAVGLVLYPRLASLPNEEIHRLTAQACRRTLLVTAPFALVLALVGPYVITLWYGKPYAPAGAPLPWAAVGVMAMSVFVIITRDFTSRERQRVNITAGLLALASNVALNLQFIPTMGIVGAAMATAISYSAACVLLIIFYLFESRLSISEVIIAKPDDFRFLWQVTRQMLVGGRRALGAGTAGTSR